MYAKDQVTILDRREMLRIKVKSLAEEAKIIRKEEKRTHSDLRNQLRNHRVLVVRTESRLAGLALGIIRGKTLGSMEPTSHTPPDWGRVRSMLKKYGNPEMVEPAFMKK